jgi:very-short-patch-repair endonuclease
MTKAESLVWHCILKNDKTGYRRLRQKPIGNYILDFYCTKLNLCIEIDWWYHDHTQEADQLREDTLLYKYGIRTIRYTNAQVESHLQWVTDDINSVILGYANKIRP